MAKSPTDLTTWQVLRLLWHLPNFVRLYWRLFKDPRVPLRAKALCIAAVFYILSPLDLFPDLLLPFFGVLDDLTVLVLTARWFISLCPPDVVQERVREISARQ
jgi:uncharacterized membrane protein YkvA (DUF1232 family)